MESRTGGGNGPPARGATPKPGPPAGCGIARPTAPRAPDRYNAGMNSSNSFPLDAAWRIDRDRLMSLVARPVRDWPIEIVDETGSTNADLMAQFKEQPRNKTSAPDSFSPRSTL